MRFTNKTVLAVLAQAFVSFAADNPFNIPTGGYNASAGQSLDLSWNPTTSGTVSLILRSGASSDLTAGTYIAQGISNSGSYTWNLPSDITRGSDYAVEIVDDSDSSKTNYTPYFVIESKNTVASSTSDISLGASATASSSSGSSSASASATSSSASASSSSASASSASSSASGSASSSASSASSSASRSASSASRSASSASRSASGSASSAAASASGSASSSMSSSGAAATVMPAVLGAFALAAYAL